MCASAGPWPRIESDLPPDPALHAGTLPNGLRYLILPNAEPRDRVSLRLLVAAGSLHEADDERGLAHFVEHMAFRGTRAFPDGSLTPALQRLGLGLGPDSTAFTLYDHTIYHLELPDTKEATLREGLRVFREYATAITFDAKSIERERGVVLSEEATRDTPAARNSRANLQFLFPQSRQAMREPIGTEEAIRRFTRAQFVAFYDAWYRPERMAVIIVGDVDATAVERIVAAELAAVAPHGLARADPDNLIPNRSSAPDIGVFSDPGMLGVGLTFEHPVAAPRGLDTHERRVHALRQALAFAMFRDRLQKTSHEPETSFVVPDTTLGWILPEWQLAALTVAGKIADWERVVADVEHEHRRAMQSGFTARELDEARAVFAAGYEEAVRAASTRPSDWLAGQLAAALLAGSVFTAPATLQRDLAPELAATSLHDCLAAFREAWTTRAPHVLVSANSSFQIRREQIAAALNGSRKTAAPPRAERAAATTFSYGSFGPPGRLVHDEPLADLDARLAEFANGVRCNFKSTRFEADAVDIHVRVGEGKLVQPKNQPGLDLLADAMLTPGGLGRHTAQELRDLLAGHTVSVGYRTEADACVFSAHCARRDVLLSLQLIAAYLTDSAYRLEALREAQAEFGTMYATLAASPGGPISIGALRTLTGGDRRFGVPLSEEISARDVSELVDWIDPQLKHGAIELSIVGDLTWDEAETTVARTLGALPARQSRADTRSAAIVHFAPTPDRPFLAPVDSKLTQCAIALFWPVPALKDVHEERRCSVLSSVLAERLRVRLREELGAAYSPSATFVHTDGFETISYFTLYAEVEAARAPQALQIVQRETAALAARGPDADEFNRAKQPYLRGMDDYLHSNAYWGTTVLADAQQRPERIAAARDRAGDLAAITRAEVTSLARRFLNPKDAFTFLTAPAASLAPPGR